MENKKIILTLTGEQTDSLGEKNKDSTKSVGNYYEKEGMHYVFVENDLTFQTVRYRFNHRFLEIVRNGDLASKLYFEAGKSQITNYKTPYGSMELSFETFSYSLLEEADEINLEIKYRILNAGNEVSVNRTKIKICSN